MPKRYKLRTPTWLVEKVSNINTSTQAWVTTALADETIVNLPDGTIVVNTVFGKRIGRVGDVVLRDLEGALTVETEARFNARYQEAK